MHLRHALLHTLVTLAGLVATTEASAAPSDPVNADAADTPSASPPAVGSAAVTQWKADPIFPGSKHASASLASGIPFVAMGELAYAPTEGFAIGAIVGVTPVVLGLGVRPRAGLPLNSRTRIAFVSPVLYYPGTGDGLIGDGPPWFLAQPALRLERRIGEGGYAHVGAGMIAAVGLPSRNERGEIVSTYGASRFIDGGIPWGVWNTVNFGGAVSIFDRTTLFADGMAILRGVRLAGDEWIGGPPFAFTLGIARVL